MSFIVPILILLLGLLLVVAEVFFPSMGILSLLATAAVGGAVVLAWVHQGATVGVLFLGGVLVLVPITLLIAFRLLPHTPMGKRLILDGPTFQQTTGTAVSEGLAGWVGAEGVALGPLRPAGMAEVRGKRLDVVTRGDMIEKGTPVRVVLVEGNRVVVARIAEQGPAAPAEGGLLRG